jgi:hypothetical protein
MDRSGLSLVRLKCPFKKRLLLEYLDCAHLSFPLRYYSVELLETLTLEASSPRREIFCNPICSNGIKVVIWITCSNLSGRSEYIS